MASGRSLRSIAGELHRWPSTLSREVRRNGGRARYRASEADQRAWKKARRPKRCRLVCRPQLRQLVEEKLRENWAPQQITGWLKRTYPGDEFCRVSHETICRSLFIQARGACKKELTQYLRSKRTIRRSQQATRKGRGGGQIQGLVSIRERPASPLFSPNGEVKCMRGASVRGARRLTSAGVLDSTLSTASKRNEGLACLSRASVGRW